MNKMGLEEYKGVFVFAQQVDNVLDGVAFELLGKGKELAKDLNTEVTAVLIGSGVKELADQLAEYGADRVIVVDDPQLKDYRTEPYAHALASVINEYKPEIMLVGATAIGRDLGPTVSARVKTGLTADCTMLEIGDFPLNAAAGQEQQHNQLLMTRPAFGGNTIATIACPYNRPQMATVRPGVMQKIAPIAGAKANVVEYNPGFTPNDRYVEILNIVKAVKNTANIMDAKILVSGGRGVGSKENFKLLEDLAEVLGGTVLLILDDDLRHQRLFLGTRTARGGSAARLEHCRALGACHVIGVGEQHIDMIGSQGCLFHQRNLAAGSGSNHGNLSGFGIRRCQRVPVVHIQDISVALQHRRHACKLFLRRIVDIRLHIDPGNVRLTQFPCGTDRQRSEKSDRAKHQHDS